MTIRTLIVEDDSQIAALHARLIGQDAAFTVVGQAESLRVARAMTRTLNPDLLLLDVYLPDGRGVDLLREFRLEGRRVDAILVTADSDSRTVQDALIHGAADYLVKPAAPERLAQALARARERHALWQQPGIRQGDLDLLFHAVPPAASGLDAQTLQRLRTELRSGEARTAAELGTALGLSRVTAWRYLEYLIEQGEVAADSEPRSVGRPVKRYRRV